MTSYRRIGVAICHAAIVVMVAVIVTACTGMKPFEPRNDREEGPEKGLFSGSQGEFIIYRDAVEAEQLEQPDKATKTSDK